MIPVLSGGLRYWEPIIAAIQDYGHRVQVVTTSAVTSSSVHVSRTRGVTVRRGRANSYPRQALLVSPSMVGTLRRTGPTCIIAVEYSLATVWGLLYARTHRVPLYVFQEHRTSGDLRPRRGRTLIRRWIARVATGVIANTDEAEEEIVTTLGVGPEKVHRVDLLVPGTAPVPSSVRPKSNGGMVTFLVVGELCGRKNPGIVLEASTILNRRGHDFQVRFIGDGDLRQSLLESVRERQLEQKVKLVGQAPFDEMADHYRCADALIMPTRADYRAMSVLEALRAGCPVLDSTADGNAGSTVVHGRNGLLFDPEDAESLACEMERFMLDAELRDELARAAGATLVNSTPTRAASKIDRLVPGCAA